MKKIFYFMFALVMVFSFTICCSASTHNGVNIPYDYKTSTGTYSFIDNRGDAIIFTYNSYYDKYTAYRITGGTLTTSASYNESQLVTSSKCTKDVFELKDGIWEFQYTESVNADKIVVGIADLFWSSVNLYNKDNVLIIEGDTNFQIPLHQMVQKMTQTEVEGKLVPEMTQTVALLTVFAIGLMALLISLIVLRKVLYRYLP